MALTEDERSPVTVAADPPMTRKLPSLTGLRAVAAALVLLVHFPYIIPVDSPPVRYLNRGNVGVSFFFILSGFILTWSHHDTGTEAREFFRRRFARVYPSHALTWVAGLGVAAWEGLHTGALPALLSMTLLQSWVPRSHYYFAANGVSWSLSDEAFFYALFPFAYVLLTRATRAQRRGLAGLALLLIAAIAVTFADDRTNSNGFWVAYIAPPVRLGEFVIGMVVALEMLDGWRPRIQYPLALTIAAASLVVLEIVPAAWALTAVTVVPFTLLIAAAASADLNGRSTTFSTRTAVKLGEWSFAFYLIHELVLRAARQILPEHKSVPVQIVALAACIALSIALSWAMHTFWERSWQRRIARGRQSELAL
jgi:peptidoglycan/LPS O-acetylase OafA/YrhL